MFCSWVIHPRKRDNTFPVGITTGIIWTIITRRSVYTCIRYVLVRKPYLYSCLLRAGDSQVQAPYANIWCYVPAPWNSTDTYPVYWQVLYNLVWDVYYIYRYLTDIPDAWPATERRIFPGGILKLNAQQTKKWSTSWCPWKFMYVPLHVYKCALPAFLVLLGMTGNIPEGVSRKGYYPLECPGIQNQHVRIRRIRYANITTYVLRTFHAWHRTHWGGNLSHVTIYALHATTKNRAINNIMCNNTGSLYVHLRYILVYVFIPVGCYMKVNPTP